MRSPGGEVKRKEAKENYDELRKLAQNMGACLFGVADVNLIKDEFLLPSSVLKHLHRGICLAAPVSGEVLDDIQDRPTPLYYHHYGS